MLPVQCRMARAALGLSVKKLAVAARVAPQKSFASNEAKKYVPAPSLVFVKFSKPLALSSPTAASREFD
jgi:hypothetical protein